MTVMFQSWFLDICHLAQMVSKIGPFFLVFFSRYFGDIFWGTGPGQPSKIPTYKIMFCSSVVWAGSDQPFD